MLRLVLFLLFVAAVASGLSWLADRPGSLLINWQGYEIRTSVFRAVVLLGLLIGLALVAWSILRGIWHLPAGLGDFFNRRREKRGLEALSSGLLAIGAGDRSLATRYAVQARKSLPNEPLTHILRAQAAQMAGDRQTARRIFESMLGQPETEAFGLRGLFLEAEREGETEAARQFAQRALAINPRLTWPVSALFDAQCKAGDWAGALATLSIARKHGHVEKQVADRRRAVLLTAQAQELEDRDPAKAMKLAEEAHALAPDLIPATAISGRLEASRGNVRKATKILERGWRKQPHPDLATAYAYARIGDSPRDRLNRVKKLASLSPHSIESPIAIAHASIEARDFDTARSALLPLTAGRLTQRVCTLMARIESEDGGKVGAVREWLARAVNAPRDPAWTADGVVADDWAPVSPVTGALDAFQYRVPVEAAEPRDGALLAEKIEELVKLGVPPETVAAAAPTSTTVVGVPKPAVDEIRAIAEHEGDRQQLRPEPDTATDREPVRPAARSPAEPEAVTERVAVEPQEPARGESTSPAPTSSADSGMEAGRPEQEKSSATNVVTPGKSSDQPSMPAATAAAKAVLELRAAQSQKRSREAIDVVEVTASDGKQPETTGEGDSELGERPRSSAERSPGTGANGRDTQTPDSEQRDKRANEAINA